MKTYSISQLARLFGLSRSTLLYYDRIGLLCAPARTSSGYRQYTQHEYDRLERICMFRTAGLSLSDVQDLLSSKAAPGLKILEAHLSEIEGRILKLRHQQHLIISMLKKMTSGTYTPVLNKAMWVKMLKTAGMDESDMMTWHKEFERCAPNAHNDFLLSLGISEEDVRHIRTWSKHGKSNAKGH